MDRRTAIKKISASLGAAATAPTLLSLLVSSTADAQSWKAESLSGEQQHIVTHLVDIILPSSQIPGALDVNVVQFIDKVYSQVFTEQEQQSFQAGASQFSQVFSSLFNRSAIRGSRNEFQQLIKTYFDLPQDQQNIIFSEQKRPLSEIDSANKNRYLIYKFLLPLRSNTLYGYFRSEKVGTQVLNFDPVPGAYDGCVPLADIGNAWTV